MALPSLKTVVFEIRRGWDILRFEENVVDQYNFLKISEKVSLLFWHYIIDDILLASNDVGIPHEIK